MNEEERKTNITKEEERKTNITKEVRPMEPMERDINRKVVIKSGD